MVQFTLQFTVPIVMSSMAQNSCISGHCLPVVVLLVPVAMHHCPSPSSGTVISTTVLLILAILVFTESPSTGSSCGAPFLMLSASGIINF